MPQLMRVTKKGVLGFVFFALCISLLDTTAKVHPLLGVFCFLMALFLPEVLASSITTVAKKISTSQK